VQHKKKKKKKKNRGGDPDSFPKHSRKKKECRRIHWFAGKMHNGYEESDQSSRRNSSSTAWILLTGEEGCGGE
jgi:hypothetical protein